MNYGCRQHMGVPDPEEMRRAVLVNYARMIKAWDVDTDGDISIEELRDRVAIRRASLQGKQYTSS